MEIAMNPWRLPHSSEHWPETIPASCDEHDIVEIRPGQTSKRKNRCGQAIEWMTSVAVPEIESEVERQRRLQQRWIAQTCPTERAVEPVKSRLEESQYH
jgi:hypothetical protein